jgi:KOW motif
MYGGEPQRVPEGVAENLIQATDEDGNVCFDFHLKEGQVVKITAGPFAGLVGQLKGLNEKRSRASASRDYGRKGSGGVTAGASGAQARASLSPAPNVFREGARSHAVVF